jgi:hypothetical protein
VLEAAELRGLDQPAAEELCDRITETGALDQVRGRAEQGIKRAKGLLGSTGFSNQELQLLGMIADGVIERYS